MRFKRDLSCAGRGERGPATQPNPLFRHGGPDAPPPPFRTLHLRNRRRGKAVGLEAAPRSRLSHSMARQGAPEEKAFWAPHIALPVFALASTPPSSASVAAMPATLPFFPLQAGMAK